MSYLVYGSKTFPDNVANVRRHDIKKRFSPRRKVLTQIETLMLEFQFQGTQAEILTQVAEAGVLFHQDYQDARFFLDGGVATSHNLVNSGDCLSGVKVISHNFPMGDGDQLATRRNYNVVLQAEYDTAETELVYWKERIEYIGDGGPDVRVEDTQFGPVDQVVSLATSIHVVQSGRAIGFLEHVIEPPAVFPARLHRNQSRVGYDSGENQGLSPAFYTTDWTYYMTLLSPALALPWTR